MKAIVCETLGPPENLVYKEVSSREPGPKEVLISVKACAINFPDTLIIQGKYQIRPDLPFTPGSDISGVIKAVGSEVKFFNEGDKVFGVLPHGGMAEEAVVSMKNVFPMPPEMSFEEGASFLYAYGTSFHAIKDRAELKAGETIAILGASGGVGLAAVDLAKSIGATVIACASTEEKLDLCKQYGADHTINYNTENLKDRLKELTGGKGVNVIYDPVGGDYAEQALRACAWKGRYLVVGFAAGTIPKLPLNLALLKGCSIVGVFWGRFAQEQPKENMANSLSIIQMYKEDKIKPHIQERYKLSEAPQALRKMMDRKVIGKVILEIG